MGGRVNPGSRGLREKRDTSRVHEFIDRAGVALFRFNGVETCRRRREFLYELRTNRGEGKPRRCWKRKERLWIERYETVVRVKN